MVARGLVVASMLALGTAAAGHASGAAPLVSMRRDTGQVFATVAIDANGRGEVGFFIGETTGTHYRSFTLAPGRLTRLRALVAETRALRDDSYLGAGNSALPFDTVTQYVVRVPSRTIQTDAAHEPARMRGLVAYLDNLITHYSRVASVDPRTRPKLASQ